MMGGEIPLSKQKSIVFVTLNDIKVIIKGKIQQISELLGVSDDEALIILNNFRWRKDLVESEWFGNEASIAKKAGLEPVRVEPANNSPTILCAMCFDTKPREEFECLKCNHYVCQECWKEYIQYNVTRPENTFFWKCPFQGCNMIIPDSFNLRYIDSTSLSQYHKKMATAYADTSKSLRWCPAADCEYAAEVASMAARAIECNCGWMYCFKCGLEDHRPCDCDVAKEWTKKDEGGGANAKWLLTFTKDCPKCRRAIEKNQGCNFMKCRHPGCEFEFCWLCLADWKTHNDHFKCNKYDNLSKEEKSRLDDDKNKERQELQKYAFYYERFMNNNIAIQSVNKIMKAIRKEEKDLALNLMLTLTQLEFLREACQVLRNSKRILKWSYGYGFYLNNELQRNLYEIIQEKLDMYSSELHVLLEKKYEECKMNIGDFTSFKENVQASVYKCKSSSEAFLEKMEEFENQMLEEQIKTAGRQDSKDDKDGKANAIPDSKDKAAGKTKKAGGIFSKLLPK